MKTQLEQDHSDMVESLVKNPEVILNGLSAKTVNLLHAAVGVSGEAGELLDAVKKVFVYDQHLDVCNVIEEMGDIEFYLEQLRQELNITREHTLTANIRKLSVRYSKGYTDEQAKNRADKL